MSAADRAILPLHALFMCVHPAKTRNTHKDKVFRFSKHLACARRGADEQKLRAEEEKRQAMEASKDRNVLGGPLALCGTDPMTGFTREGCCTTGPMDTGSHTVGSHILIYLCIYLYAQVDQGHVVEVCVYVYGLVEVGEGTCLLVLILGMCACEGRCAVW